MPHLDLTLVTGETVKLELAANPNAESDLANLTAGDGEYGGQWIRIDDTTLVSRAAIAKVAIGRERTGAAGFN